MPKINRTYCSVYGCLNNNIKNSIYSFFSIPTKRELRMRWLQVMSRMDLEDEHRYHRVCEQHFKPEEILVKSTRRLLKKNVVPSLHLPNIDFEDITNSPHVKHEESEEIQEIKQEIEDSFSEHEDDITEAVENKKRKNNDPLAGFSKKDKIENKVVDITVDTSITNSRAAKIPEKQREIIPLVTVDVKRENDLFPVDFMKSVLNSQEEILSVLKSQILLENPNPGLLSFLRLIGAKLSRLSRKEREEVQGSILNVIDNFK